MNDFDNVIKDVIPKDKDYLIGYADLQGLLPDKYLGLDYAIALGRRLDDNIIDSIVNGPNIEYYNHYNEVNKELSEAAHLVGEKIRRLDAQARRQNAPAAHLRR